MLVTFKGLWVNLMGWESEASFPTKSRITSIKYRNCAPPRKKQLAGLPKTDQSLDQILTTFHSKGF